MNTNTQSLMRAVLDRCVIGNEDPVRLLADLAAAIRPAGRRDPAFARTAQSVLVKLLEQSPTYRDALRKNFLDLMDQRKLVSFFAGSGMLPDAGFFSELWRITVNKVLPDAIDATYLRDAMQTIFCKPDDHLWLATLSPETSTRFWEILELDRACGSNTSARAARELLRSILVVCHRICAMGWHRDFVRSDPHLEDMDSPFIALGVEIHRYIADCDSILQGASCGTADEQPLMSCVLQCRNEVHRVSAGTMMRGTSLDLSYLLVRLSQNIDRIELLVRMAAARFSASPSDDLLDVWTQFLREGIRGDSERNSLRRYWSRLTGTLALRITQNAGQTGEHYITEDRTGYFLMLRSAAGAGVIISLLALVKIFASKLELAPLPAALVYSLNYALGFMLVHVLHGTIATKQPAMTASSIAAKINDSAGGLKDVDTLAALVINILRSQFAAICGNVLLAFPCALLLGAALNALFGVPFINPAKTEHLLHDLNPLAISTFVHAAIAGVWLFLAGLISGYFDNAAAHHRLPERVGRASWLKAWVGVSGASRVANYLNENLGALAGNFFFGFMLGCTALLGLLLGADIDIRHIAFGAANFAYALAGTGFEVSYQLLLTCAVGVVLIGLVNLTVSFILALWVALRAHGVRYDHVYPLGSAIIRQILAKPLSLVWPPAATKTPS
jgi:site-specific recombinase